MYQSRNINLHEENINAVIFKYISSRVCSSVVNSQESALCCVTHGHNVL